jgi:hypothetical protein
VVEHAIPLLVLGMVIVPVTPEATGLTPGDTSSVAPIGMPVVPTDAPGTIASGEGAPSGGVSVPTWANAGPQHNRGQAVAATKMGLMEHFSDKRAAASTAVSSAVDATTFFFMTAHKGKFVSADAPRSTFR